MSMSQVRLGGAGNEAMARQADPFRSVPDAF
jgi:hypothetical protein